MSKAFVYMDQQVPPTTYDKRGLNKVRILHTLLFSFNHSQSPDNFNQYKR